MQVVGHEAVSDALEAVPRACLLQDLQAGFDGLGNAEVRQALAGDKGETVGEGASVVEALQSR